MRTAVRHMATLAGLLLAMTASVTAFAVDAVPTVEVSGTVLDTEGHPAEVESARVDEFETQESEAIRTTIDVAADGTFTVSLREWGTAEQPAIARFAVFGPRGEPVVINDEGCTEQTTPFGTVDVEIPGEVPAERIEIVLDQTLIDGLCPAVTATPDPEPKPDAQAPAVTLPPTDAQAGATSALAGSVTAALLIAGLALLGVGSMLARRSNRPS
jgi:hypothetical protein